MVPVFCLWIFLVFEIEAKTLSVIDNASLPDNRIIAIAPCPGAEAMAQMVSDLVIYFFYKNKRNSRILNCLITSMSLIDFAFLSINLYY
jgi:nucleoside recognition membrane protein YjiH